MPLIQTVGYTSYLRSVTKVWLSSNFFFLSQRAALAGGPSQAAPLPPPNKAARYRLRLPSWYQCIPNCFVYTGRRFIHNEVQAI